MKKILTTGLVLATMSGAAFAADLPNRVAPPVYTPPPVPTFTWTGAYFGINAGYAFDHEGRNTLFDSAPGGLVANGFVPGRRTVSADGFTGGGQIGYNYQLGGFGGFGGFGGPGSGIVVGVEADAAYTDLNRASTFSAVDAAGNVDSARFRNGLDYLGTVRGRVGYAFGQFMIYGTGGFAYGGVDNRAVFAINGVPYAAGSRDRMATGYTYGGGIEYALPTNSFLNFFKSSAVTLKAEYLHYDLGHSSYAVGNSGTFVRASNDGDLARVGLNYKFGSY